MKKIVLFGLILAFILLAGRMIWGKYTCNIHTGLSAVESLMYTSPDSAFKMLQNIGRPECFSKRNKALYALLLTQAQYDTNHPVKNDSLIRIALDYYITDSDSIRKAWAYFYAAQISRDMREHDKAVKYFQQAAVAASKSDNYKLLSLIYYQWGEVLQRQKPYEDGLNKLLVSKKYMELNEDTIRLISTYKEIGQCYVYMKNYRQARTCYQNCIRLAKKIKDEAIIAFSFYQIAMTYCMEDNYIHAFYYINHSLSQGWITEDSLTVYSAKARILLGLQEYDSARYYIEKNKNAVDYYQIANYQDQMAILEERIGNYHKALEHRTIYAKYLDSIADYEVNKDVLELQKKYDYSLIKSENDCLKIETQRRKILVLVITLFSSCLFFAFYYWHNRVKKQNEKLIYSKDLLLSESLNQIQQKSNELLKEKQLIQEKEEELKLHLLNERVLVEDISHKEAMLYSYESKQQELKKQIFEMDVVVQKIDSLKRMNDKQKITSIDILMLTEQERFDLIAAIDSCFDQFATRLHNQYPVLSQEDICICCLLRMGVSNYNIVILLNTNDEALKKRKYRIKREKIGLIQEGLSLETYLISF